MLNDDLLEQALVTLGSLLEDRGEDFELAVIGGGALLLMGLIERPTEDLDVVSHIVDGDWLIARPFPAALQTAVLDVADALELASNWLNPGPTGLMASHGLPTGFEERSQTRRYGSLTLRLAARKDQIILKLDAAADHLRRTGESKHLADLRRLSPTASELQEARAWCLTHRATDRLHDLDEIITELLFGDW